MVRSSNMVRENNPKLMIVNIVFKIFVKIVN